LPERTAYRRATDDGKALCECPFPTLKKKADDVVQAIMDRLSALDQRSAAYGQTASTSR